MEVLITELSINKTIIKSLIFNNINNVDDLIQITYADMLKLRNVDKKRRDYLQSIQNRIIQIIKDDNLSEEEKTELIKSLK